MNPTQTQPVTFQGGAALPAYGTDAYKQAQQGIVAPGFSATPTITSSSIKPVTPYSLPTPTATPTTTNLGLATNTALSGASVDASYTPPVNTDKQTVNTGLQSLISKITGQQTQIDQINNDADLIAKKNRAQSISTEIDQLDKGFRDEIKSLKESYQGSPAGLQQEIASRQDRYENTRANIALTYKVASQDYQGAQEIANQKIQSLKDTNTQALQAYQLAVNAINNDLTESEKLQAQANITRKEKQAQSIEDAYSTVLQNAVKNGAPASVLSALDAESRNPNATMASIYARAGQYAITPDTQITKLDNGQTVIVDKATGTIVKNLGGAKEAELQAGDNPQLYKGLSTPTATAVRSKVSAFKTEPIVQNFATVQEGYNFAKSLSNTTKNPADDQALVYALAKALDPGSVVREGEYATAQKYAQSWIKAYGKGVEQALLGTGFLSEDARKNIKSTIEQKYNASKTSYDNLYSRYSDGINNLTGRADGTRFLTDYAITTSQPTANTAPVTSGTVGNGVTFKVLK